MLMQRQSRVVVRAAVKKEIFTTQGKKEDTPLDQLKALGQEWLDLSIDASSDINTLREACNHCLNSDRRKGMVLNLSISFETLRNYQREKLKEVGD